MTSDLGQTQRKTGKCAKLEMQFALTSSTTSSGGRDPAYAGGSVRKRRWRRVYSHSRGLVTGSMVREVIRIRTFPPQHFPHLDLPPSYHY